MSGAEIAQHIAALAVDGVQVTLWPTKAGFQANVTEGRGTGNGWTCVTRDDPVDALLGALRSRVTRLPDRTVTMSPEPEQQLDIEDVTVDCAHGVPMHLTCGACEEERAMAELGL